MASPVLSADGSTVYVNGRDERLWALHTADGKAKWSVPLGFLAQTPPSVSPQGLIVAGGGPDTRLVGVKDGGDHADVAWRRDDVTPLSTSSRAGSGRRLHGGPRTARSGHGAAGVRPRRRAHRQHLSAARRRPGFPVGVSVGHDRRVVTATSDGQVYGFAPA